MNTAAVWNVRKQSPKVDRRSCQNSTNNQFYQKGARCLFFLRVVYFIFITMPQYRIVLTSVALEVVGNVINCCRTYPRGPYSWLHSFFSKMRFSPSNYVTILSTWTPCCVVPQTSWQCWITVLYEPCDFPLRKLRILLLVSFPGTPELTSIKGIP